MKCPKCGNEVEGKFCPECGTALSQDSAHPDAPVTPPVYYQAQPRVPSAPPMQPTMPPTKNKKLKWWQILLIILVVFGIIGAALGSGDSDSTTTSSTALSGESSSILASSEVHASSDTPSISPEEKKANYIAQCKKFDFKTIARNPDKYKGEYYAITGEVIQVTEGYFNQVDLRINVTKDDYGYWDDTIYVTITIPAGEDKILENDIITLYGQCDGNYSYTSVLGASISLPKINAEYYELKESK